MGEYKWGLVTSEVLMLVCLNFTVGVSLDFHPREIFFKCLSIIIKKDKENKVRGQKQY